MQIIIIYSLTILILSIREYFFMRERQQWAVERKQLLDRIQAKDYSEYKRFEQVKEPEKDKEEKPVYELL